MAKASYRLPWVSFSKVRLGARSFIKNEFHLRVKKTLFHKKGWAQRLTLKKSLRANWEIAYCSGITDLFTFSFFFQLSTWTSSGKSVDTTEKSALRSVKREICWKLMEIQLLKVAKFCRRFYGGEMGGGGGGWRTHFTPPNKRLWISATSRSYIFARLRRITFKFGSITNFKALFSVVSTDFP